jgi:patatin-like phospholipase/acyl hydrolase
MKTIRCQRVTDMSSISTGNSNGSYISAKLNSPESDLELVFPILLAVLPQ